MKVAIVSGTVAIASILYLSLAACSNTNTAPGPADSNDKHTGIVKYSGIYDGVLDKFCDNGRAVYTFSRASDSAAIAVVPDAKECKEAK